MLGNGAYGIDVVPAESGCNHAGRPSKGSRVGAKGKIIRLSFGGRSSGPCAGTGRSARVSIKGIGRLPYASKICAERYRITTEGLMAIVSWMTS